MDNIKPTSGFRAFVGDQLRAWQLLLCFVVLIAIVVAMAPAKLGLTLYGFGKIIGGLYVGLWGDRLIFPYARPHEQVGSDRMYASFRRAIIIGLCALASALIP